MSIPAIDTFTPTYLDPLLSVTFGAITFGAWDDRFGIIAIAGAGSTYDGSSIQGDIIIVKPDMTCIRIGQRGRAWTGVGWSYPDDMIMLRGSSPNGVSRILLPSLAETDSDTGWTETNFAYMPADAVAARYLRFNGNNVTYDLVSGGGTVVECVINTGQPGPGRIFPADFSKGQSLWWLVDCGNGKIYQYDALAKAEVAAKRTIFAGGACTCPVYSRKHNVFGNIIGGGLAIFANEPSASTIATPTFSSSPTAGKRRTISTTVLGTIGEPVIGRIVRFTATNGTIDVPNVATNSSGVASTYWKATFSAAAGPETLTATLTE